MAKFNSLAEGQYFPPIRQALIYTALDEKEQALTWLEKAYEDRSYWMAFLKIDPRFDRLRVEPRFKKLLSAVNLA